MYNIVKATNWQITTNLPVVLISYATMAFIVVLVLWLYHGKMNHSEIDIHSLEKWHRDLPNTFLNSGKVSFQKSQIRNDVQPLLKNINLALP